MKAKKPGKQPRRKRATGTVKTAKKATAAKPTGLTYRPRTASDDPFLKQVTIAEMKDVYEQSTGMTLTEDGVEMMLAISETTVIIEHDGRPIGYYSYLMPSPGRMYLGSLIFVPNAQGNGNGAKVCRRIEEDARREGAQIIDLHVQVSNRRALRFWINNGYRIAGPPVAGSLPMDKKL